MTAEIKVISLARSHQRRDRFIGTNLDIDFDFFDAIDGEHLQQSVLDDPRLFAPPLTCYTPGAFGCALSHLRLWELARARGEPLTIAEDDAVFRRDFHPQSESLLASLPAGWDVVVWGWNFDSILSLNVMPGVSPAVVHFNQDSLRAGMSGFRSMDLTPVALPLDKCFGTPAYTISPQGAERFIAGCFPLSDFLLYFPGLGREVPNTGIDIAMNRIYCTTNSYVSFVPLVATPNLRHQSTVQAS